MTWYKESKLFEKEDVENNDAFDDRHINPFKIHGVEKVLLQCPNCRKWATGTEENTREWKYYYQMNPQQQAEIDKGASLEHNTKTRIMTFRCDNCQEAV